MSLRVASLVARGRDVRQVAETLRAHALAFEPSALFWITDANEPDIIANVMADCSQAAVGAVSKSGLIGDGLEWSPKLGEVSATALAIGLPNGATAQSFSSTIDGLPNLPAESWATFASAVPEASPHMLLMATPPRHGAFPLERWLGMLDTALPWARKVGGLTAGGEGILYAGAERHDGGAVGLALQGVDLQARSFQGAIPIGASYEITASDGNLVQGLDGHAVGDVIGDTIDEFLSSDGQSGSLMCGVSVPTRAAARGSTDETDDEHEYVIRAILGFSKQHSILAVGASPDLLSAPGARLQLHSFSAEAARAELRAGAAAIGRENLCGGLLVSCAGRGEALYGEAGVETAELKRALGDQLAVAGMFAGGEVGPVGARTFVHTYTSTVGLLRPMP